VERSTVRLPPEVRPPFDVYVNGVAQKRGTDYTVRGDRLVFDRPLAQEGKVGLWRWVVGAIGIGTYRAHHSVDVRYTRPDGQPTVAENLPVERPAGPGTGARLPPA
jgi:hypothetical protein